MPEPLKHGAVLFAKDLPRMATFYEQLLSMHLMLRQDDLILLDGDDFQLVLHALPAEVAASVQITLPPQRRANVPTKLVYPVASLSQARADAPRLGGALDGPDCEWQGPYFRACDGYDPEGNVLQLREPV
ncbi:MAG: hypothetical protein PW845_00405 [Pseudomonas sp.]|uniref:hypothetical protein n=1 Tax=Pseudomonas abieticivorans TaxID=2931382 RepID=UPI0020C12E08|nr:hypothetical protein [Pseudomonas sp. PIA16]MDE1163861.1 hypothetical protein [Pseudomonas sp.]